MRYVGIDVAKNKHDCHIVDADGNEVVRFTITNTRSGYQKLQEYLGDKDDVRVGLEATGHYHVNLVNFLSSLEYSVHVFNPLEVKMFHKSRSLRKTKTDKVDASVIAALLQSRSDQASHSPLSYHIDDVKSEIKGFSRLRYDITSERTRQKLILKRVLERTFPELESLIDIYSRTAHAILAAYPSTKELSQASVDTLTKLIQKASRGYYDEELATNIISTAKSSIGSSNECDKFAILHTLQNISRLNLELEEITKRLEALLTEVDAYLLSIPGISVNLAAIILGEIGDFSRFSSPDKILAFAGMSPTTYQSGQYLATQAKMEKRGSKYLRFALYCSAKQVCLHSPEFREYYEKKRLEGKHYNVALSHVAKRLVRLIYAMHAKHTVYQARKPKLPPESSMTIVPSIGIANIVSTRAVTTAEA